MSNIGIVIIGRNEGEKLKRCVQSVIDYKENTVYVDSGSVDDSATFCRENGLHVWELDSTIPFSAARARNEGMNLLLSIHPKLDFIQFIDGDCELFGGWVNCAIEKLQHNEKLAIVCGRRKERYPRRSIFNQLCDIEWNTIIGQTKSCGGDFMGRVCALTQVGGFNPTVVAGEEPELCYRLRMVDWQIERIDADMTKHDAMITKFSQWWYRTIRSGHAYMNNMILHWKNGQRFNVRNVLSIMFWGVIFPLFLLLSAIYGLKYVVVILLILYLSMVFKITTYMITERNISIRNSLYYSFFTMIGKTPQAIGVIMYTAKWLGSGEYKIIEYK